jgi:pimeloyl-ACP methyl ester carboxylesterase
MAMLEFGEPSRPVDLIFLHANGFNALTYRVILEPLEAGAHILALDMRGHGRSTLETRTEGRRSWLDLRDDLLVFLKTLDIADVVLAGHSMGGAVSIFAAADVPHRVRRLVLMDPVMPPAGHRFNAANTPLRLVAGALKRRAVFPSREAAVETYRGRSAFKGWSAEMLVDYVSGGFLDLPTGEVTLACRPEWESSNFAAQDQDVWDAVPHILCPITVLRAEFDSTCRIDGAAEALTADGRLSIETIAGAGHFLPMERPEVCREALRTALEA